jgi:alkylhydroperoxidase family enzyme
MLLNPPRIHPLQESEWDDETRALLESYRREGRVYNIFTTLAHHPKLMNRWLVFGKHILSQSTLPAREREIAILRVGWLCRAEYEWGHHVVGAGQTPGETIGRWRAKRADRLTSFSNSLNLFFASREYAPRSEY